MRLLTIFVLVLVMAPRPLAAEWVRVDSPNFVVFGEGGERRTREYALEFERFREALGRIVPGAATRSTVPILVFIFNDQRSFGPYRPEFNGKPIQLSGYAWRDSNLGVMMLAASDREAALRVILHEYTHLLIANVTFGLPVWLNEGLAEYYSTFTVAPDGRSAMLGGIIRGHLQRLNEERPLSIEELLAVQHDSPLYNEGSRRSVFYAQSWALVHMLLNGEPDRGDAVRRYVQLVGSGKSAADAWREVFGDAKVLDDLHRYVRRTILTAYRFKFAESIASTSFAVSKPSPDDVLAALGDLRRMVTPERAAAHIDGLSGSKSLYGAAVRGLALLDRDEYDDALPLLLEATRGSDDWLVQYRAAVGLERIVRSRTSAPATATEAALAALDRVHASRPELPHPYALRAMMLGSAEEALEAIRRARELAPGREQYALSEAQLWMRRGEFAEARKVLAPLLSPAYPPEIREPARTMMGRTVTMERSRTSAAAREDAGRQEGARQEAPTTEAGGERAAHPPSRVTHVFRELEPGEQRVEGILERIECRGTAPELHVRADDRTLRFKAPKLDTVEFITYRDELTGSVGCGPRTPPDRVYVTFTPVAGSDGLVVAVEFLPVKDGMSK